MTGVQEEYFGMSQIDVTDGGDVQITNGSDNFFLLTPSTLNLPASGSTADATTLEEFEGMLVQIPQELTATEYFELARYGQIVMSEGGKLRQFTNDNVPDAAGFSAHQDEIATRRIILDDLNNFQNIDPVYYPQTGGFAVDNFFRGGYTITGLTGVLHWSWAGSGGTDAWRVRPQVTNPPVFAETNPRDEYPEPIIADIRVASFNVLNYFNGDGLGGGFPTSRGADSPAEFDRQTAKIVDAIIKLDADIVGLVELENDYTDGANSSIATLVDALNTELGDDLFDWVDPGQNVGDDEIAVGIIFLKDIVKVKPGTTVEVLDDSDLMALGMEDEAPLFDGLSTNRASLAATFKVKEVGNPSKNERLTIAVNHFKSKGDSGLEEECEEEFSLNCDQGDGQGYWNYRRTKAAEALLAWLESDPTGANDPDYLIIGDINAYAMEDPVTTIQANGYEELINRFGEAGEEYSYVFDGQWGYLDHALSNTNLTPQVTGITEWHINSDEVNLLDYNDIIQDPSEASFNTKPPTNELFAPDAYRSSDHDPLLLGLNLDRKRCVVLDLITYDYDEGQDETTYVFDLETFGCNKALKWINFKLGTSTIPIAPSDGSIYSYPGNAHDYLIDHMLSPVPYTNRIHFRRYSPGVNPIAGERFEFRIEGSPLPSIDAFVKTSGPTQEFHFEFPEEEMMEMNIMPLNPETIVTEARQEGELGVFPNPASDWVQVMFDVKQNTGDRATLSLVSSLGQVIRSHKVELRPENIWKMNVNSLPAGIYIVQLRNENILQSQQLVVH